ncbi:hypothetical protein HYY75_03230 [bacterium]|nr:hypothetical protein [bacterium]
MNVVYITSSVNYVKDNYFHLLKAISEKGVLSEKISVAGLMLLKTDNKLLAKSILGLLVAGGPRVAITLFRNFFSSVLRDSRISQYRSLGIPVFKLENINDPRSISVLRKLNPDLLVNLRTRNIYKREVLELPKLACINIHHGLLPENRGTMCDLWAWVEGRPVGFSIHRMNERVDDGVILTRQEIDVSVVKSYIDIPFTSSFFEAKALIKCLNHIVDHGFCDSIENSSKMVRYTRNPTYRQIRDIRRRGFLL